jgi:4-hydroxybenzoate polyprenyltransferase
VTNYASSPQRARIERSPDRHAMVDQAMRRIRFSAAVLSLILLGLLARAAIDGLTVATGASAAFIALLLVALAWLWRQGRRLSQRAPEGQPKTR